MPWHHNTPRDDDGSALPAEPIGELLVRQRCGRISLLGGSSQIDPVVSKHHLETMKFGHLLKGTLPQLGDENKPWKMKHLLNGMILQVGGDFKTFFDFQPGSLGEMIKFDDHIFSIGLKPATGLGFKIEVFH